jgi:DNA-binding HxlR family transcriptional regulator
LKELEMNGFINRRVYTGMPVVIEYGLTAYSITLDDVLRAMIDWGIMHRNKTKSEAKKKRLGALKKI